MIKLSRRAVAAAAALLAVGTTAATWAATSASAAPAKSNTAKSDTARAAEASAFIPRCTPGQLAVWVNADSADGTAGTTYYHLEYTNISRATCHLYSWPGVSATNTAGRQLGVPAVRTGGVPATYVNISPGGTAHSVLGYVDVQVSRACKPVTATYLKVYPPDDTGFRRAFFALPVCTTKTQDLTIWRVQPGA